MDLGKQQEGDDGMGALRIKGMAFSIIGCLFCILLCGCPGKRKQAIYDDVVPREIGLPLSERFEEGVLITDVKFDMIHFTYDQYQVSSSESYKIEVTADYMISNPSVFLIVEGHCDERGSREYNLSLGELRSSSVRAYLISLGVDSARIQTRTYGEEKPLEMGHGEAAWSMNRRAEFVLFR